MYQQHIFYNKSLDVGVCYGCGHVLFTCDDNVHTYLTDKPSGCQWTEDDTPARAYYPVHMRRGKAISLSVYLLLSPRKSPDLKNCKRNQSVEIGDKLA